MRTDFLHRLASWPRSGVTGGTAAHRGSIRQMPNRRYSSNTQGGSPVDPTTRDDATPDLRDGPWPALPAEPGSTSPLGEQ